MRASGKDGPAKGMGNSVTPDLKAEQWYLAGVADTDLK